MSGDAMKPITVFAPAPPRDSPGVEAAAAGTATRTVPHWLQKLAVSRRVVPHWVQVAMRVSAFLREIVRERGKRAKTDPW
jgi:hypothetical protein